MGINFCVAFSFFLWWIIVHFIASGVFFICKERIFLASWVRYKDTEFINSETVMYLLVLAGPTYSKVKTRQPKREKLEDFNLTRPIVIKNHFFFVILQWSLVLIYPARKLANVSLLLVSNYYRTFKKITILETYTNFLIFYMVKWWKIRTINVICL